jgi:serine phosphatase RsbU (regulator of sigma subunit)
MKIKTVGHYLIALGIIAGLCGFSTSIFLEIKLIILIITVPLFLVFTNIGISFCYIHQEEVKRKKAASWLLGIGLFLIVIGSLSKFLYFIGATLEIIIGISVLCFAYGPLLTKTRLQKWLPYASSKYKAIALALTDFFSVIFIISGIVFNIQHWPGGSILFYAGVLLLFISIKFWNNVFKKEIVLRKQAEEKVVKQKKLVEEKNREILDSIAYALKIQTAILPSQKIVQQYLENSFILYKPKDIVAGDFYWMETSNDLVLFAACDCTGHGVPGAMVSVVCHNALNRAVREFGLTQPAAILDKTAEIVIENFSKSEEAIKDGMDISLCAYHVKEKKIQWAGANNPLWLIRNGELIETKADKQPIGMNENSKPFTNHTFSLQTGETIYLFTDGFADQFGGDKGQKKLTKKRFKDLILSVQHKSLQEQGIALDQFITNYRKEVEQIDDILVMGVKV